MDRYTMTEEETAIWDGGCDRMRDEMTRPLRARLQEQADAIRETVEIYTHDGIVVDHLEPANWG